MKTINENSVQQSRILNLSLDLKMKVIKTSNKTTVHSLIKVDSKSALGTH